MVKGMHKSRTFRRVQRKTPGSKSVLHHVLNKPSAAKCGTCSDVLKGVPRERPIKMQNMAKSSKRPERPYGGVLCTRCTRKKLIEQAN